MVEQKYEGLKEKYDDLLGKFDQSEEARWIYKTRLITLNEQFEQ